METVPRNRFVPGLTFFVTTSVKDRKPLLIEEKIPELIMETLQFFRRNREIFLIGYVIMPDHIHLVVTLRGELLLPVFVRRFKSYVSKNSEMGPIWEKGCWSKVIGSEAGLRETMDYIHLNPIRAHLVDKPEDYLWSSARGYFYQDATTGVDFWWDAP
jgi:putative transposase